MSAATPSRWRHVPAAALAAIFVAPIVLMVSGSLRAVDQPPPRVPELLPNPVVFDNYAQAFDLVDIQRYAINSALVSGISVPLAVVVGSMAGFAMTRLRRPWAAVFLVASLVALMVPATATLVPRFALFRTVGLTGTYVPLIAPAMVGMSPFYVLIFYRAFRRLPAGLLDAARLEGLSPFAIWSRIGMPLVRGATIAVSVLAFAVSWGNLPDAIVFLTDERMFTLPVGTKALAVLVPHMYPLMLAGAVAATAPVVLLFVFAQRRLFQEVGR